MSRTRSLALLALLAAGCVLAAGAASTGPFLEADREVPGFGTRIRDENFAVRVERERDLGGELPTYELVGRVFNWLLLIVLAGLLLYGLYRLIEAVMRLRELRLARSRADRRTKAYDPGEETREDAETVLRRRVADELRLLSVDLDADVDPREAVIACYVRMENALAAAGTPREATETPLELVERVLGSYDVPPADVRRLTALFTEARFSSHPVTDEMRAAARRSLAAVSDALAVRA